MIQAIKIKRVKIDQLAPAEYNPREILRVGDKGYERLKNSLMEFGEVLPIVWNEKTGNIVGGHQRYYMYLDEGIKSLDVSVVNLSLKKEKALNITLNNENVGSTWDKDKLALLVGELDAPDLELTGFDDSELESLIGELGYFDGVDLGGDDLQDEEEDPEDGPELQEAEELPYEGDGKDALPAQEVYIKIGKYEFMLERILFDTWLRDIKETYGDDTESVIDGIKERLQI